MDIRWKQRLQSYSKALSQLKEAVDLSHSRKLSRIESQGLIKAFEFTHELSWNVIKDFFEYQGQSGIMGSRDAVREAFQKALISDGDVWMEMIASRNQTSHTYNESTIKDLMTKIITNYFEAFVKFEAKMLSLSK